MLFKSDYFYNFNAIWLMKDYYVPLNRRHFMYWVYSTSLSHACRIHFYGLLDTCESVAYTHCIRYFQHCLSALSLSLFYLFIFSEVIFPLLKVHDSSGCSFNRKLLIADARPTFTSQIPESLKEDLIEQLRSICEGKKAFSRTLIN